MFDNGCYLVRRLCGLSQEDEGSSLCPEWVHPQYPVLIGRHAHEEICSQVAVQQDPGRPGKSSVVIARQTPIFGRISSSLAGKPLIALNPSQSLNQRVRGSSPGAPTKSAA
ncbi:hypothetical protein ACVME8_008713 [Bradyrhizobium diazoefficiens]